VRVADLGSFKAQLAVHCMHLSRSIGREAREPVAICLHPVREGKECIGPFLEDLSTDCGLWEVHPQSHLIPLPQPQRWQRRRRREGYDLQRYSHGDHYRDDHHR
jgi:hypothetical protein